MSTNRNPKSFIQKYILVIFILNLINGISAQTALDYSKNLVYRPDHLPHLNELAQNCKVAQYFNNDGRNLSQSLSLNKIYAQATTEFKIPNKKQQIEGDPSDADMQEIYNEVVKVEKILASRPKDAFVLESATKILRKGKTELILKMEKPFQQAAIRNT